MAMLIAPDDLKVYGVDPEAYDQARVLAMITQATAAITDAAGCPILCATSTLTVLGTRDRVLELPGRPITAVESVYVDDEKITDFKIALAGLYRPQGWAHSRDLPEITVTYTHGYPTVPEDVKALAAAMVIAGLNAADEGGWELRNGRYSSVAIDDYREAYATGGEGLEQVTPMSLPERTRRWLHTRFGGGAQVLRVL